ncbi:MAG: glycosyltransferase family 2 protein, partial [Candidatus Micrarchaeaceae archaeon]
YEIILVDNASTDGSADRLAQRYPEVHLVRSPRNCGIAGGNNLGIRTSRGRYVLLLNNDTLVLPGTLERAVSYLEKHPEVAGVGGNLLNPDGSFQAGYVDFPSLWQEFLIVSKLGSLWRSYYPSHPPAAEEREVDWMSTAFMAFRRETLEQVGLVDEEYFIYSDETDLQYRLKQAGWKIVYLPDLRTIHFGGKSLNPWRRRHLVYRGKLLFFRKHYGPWRTAALRALFVAAGLLKMLIWAFLWLLPSCRSRARNELSSYARILRFSFLSVAPLP